MTGKNADETGLVVSILDNVVTSLSDMSMQEVSGMRPNSTSLLSRP